MGCSLSVIIHSVTLLFISYIAAVDACLIGLLIGMFSSRVRFRFAHWNDFFLCWLLANICALICLRFTLLLTNWLFGDPDYMVEELGVDQCISLSASSTASSVGSP
jgi:hypothetical protein